jgi:hypothetical protein
MFALFDGASQKISRNLIRATGLKSSLAVFQENNIYNIGPGEVLKLLLAMDACNLSQTMKEEFIAKDIQAEDAQDILDDYLMENLRDQTVIPCRDGGERMDLCLGILDQAAKFQEYWSKDEFKDPGPRFYCVKELLRRLGSEANTPIHDSLFEFVYEQHNRFNRYFRTLLEPFREADAAPDIPPESALRISGLVEAQTPEMPAASGGFDKLAAGPFDTIQPLKAEILKESAEKASEPLDGLDKLAGFDGFDKPAPGEPHRPGEGQAEPLSGPGAAPLEPSWASEPDVFEKSPEESPKPAETASEPTAPVEMEKKNLLDVISRFSGLTPLAEEILPEDPVVPEPAIEKNEKPPSNDSFSLENLLLPPKPKNLEDLLASPPKALPEGAPPKAQPTTQMLEELFKKVNPILEEDQK